MKGINFYQYKNDYAFTRFLCKIAIESYVYGVIHCDKYNEAEALVTNEIFKEIITFVRIGNVTKTPWKVEASIIEDYKPFEDSKYHRIKCYFDEKSTEDSIIFNIEFFGTKFSLDLMSGR